jgi:hypothetical protein
VDRVPAPRTVGLPALVRRTHALLQAGVPLTLLIDLSEPHGPRSRELYATEDEGVLLAR